MSSYFYKCDRNGKRLSDNIECSFENNEYFTYFKPLEECKVDIRCGDFLRCTHTEIEDTNNIFQVDSVQGTMYECKLIDPPKKV